MAQGPAHARGMDGWGCCNVCAPYTPARDKPMARCAWVADITYVPTEVGFLYLAVVLDAFSRKIVGGTITNNLRAELVLDALEMAVGQRRPMPVRITGRSQDGLIQLHRRLVQSGAAPFGAGIWLAHGLGSRHAIHHDRRLARKPTNRLSKRGNSALNPTGTFLRRYLAQFVAVADT